MNTPKHKSPSLLPLLVDHSLVVVLAVDRRGHSWSVRYKFFLNLKFE